jgi:ribonuclease VapC
LIVDTSALVAIVLTEPGWQDLRSAVARAECVIPAPVLLELKLSTAKHGEAISAGADKLIDRLLHAGAVVASYEDRHATLFRSAGDLYGKGNGRGGLLNFSDLMVYAIAKDRGEPLLCTGRDFASTDLEIHPASRLDV